MEHENRALKGERVLDGGGHHQLLPDPVGREDGPRAAGGHRRADLRHDAGLVGLGALVADLAGHGRSGYGPRRACDRIGFPVVLEPLSVHRVPIPRSGAKRPRSLIANPPRPSMAPAPRPSVFPPSRPSYPQDSVAHPRPWRGFPAGPGGNVLGSVPEPDRARHDSPRRSSPRRPSPTGSGGR